MNIAVTFLVLTAAVMHAIWNAFIKRAVDKVAMATSIYGSGLIIDIPGIILFPFPLIRNLATNFRSCFLSFDLEDGVGRNVRGRLF